MVPQVQPPAAEQIKLGARTAGPFLTHFDAANRSERCASWQLSRALELGKAGQILKRHELDAVDHARPRWNMPICVTATISKTRGAACRGASLRETRCFDPLRNSYQLHRSTARVGRALSEVLRERRLRAFHRAWMLVENAPLQSGTPRVNSELMNHPPPVSAGGFSNAAPVPSRTVKS